MPTPAAAFPTRPVASISETDIENAIRNDSRHCMVADALAREYPEATRILVDVRTVRMTDPIRKKRYTWMTPYAAARFLVRWDQGIRPPEFSVRLRTPLAITDSGATGSGQKAGPNPRTSRSAQRITGDGTVIGGHPVGVGPLAASAPKHNKPPAASRNRGYGINALKEAPE